MQDVVSVQTTGRATKQTRRPPEGGDGWEALKYCANHARVVYKEKATASCPIYKSFIYLFIWDCAVHAKHIALELSTYKRAYILTAQV